MTENITNVSKVPNKKFNINKKDAMKVGAGVVVGVALVVAYRKNVAKLVSAVEAPDALLDTTTK